MLPFRKVETFLRKNVIVVVMLNLVIAVLWIPATIYSFLTPKKQDPSALSQNKARKKEEQPRKSEDPSLIPSPPQEAKQDENVLPPSSMPPPELPPDRATTLPKPNGAQQKNGGRKEERDKNVKKDVKDEKRERNKREEEKEQEPLQKAKEEEKVEKKEEQPSKTEKREDPPPRGPFGFSCSSQGCFMFDISSGKRYSKGDTIHGWYIKEITIHGAVLVKEGREVRVGVE